MIGRTDKCDLQIAEASVSSQHCELQFDGTWWWITDSKSRNGTRVNGGLVTRRQVVDGDILLIGTSVRLKFDDASNCRTEAPAAAKRSLSTWQIALIAVAALVMAAAGVYFATRGMPGLRNLPFPVLLAFPCWSRTFPLRYSFVEACSRTDWTGAGCSPDRRQGAGRA